MTCRLLSVDRVDVGVECHCTCGHSTWGLDEGGALRLFVLHMDTAMRGTA